MSLFPLFHFIGSNAPPADMLGTNYGSCLPTQNHCFGRLPTSLNEDKSELLIADSAGNVVSLELNLSLFTFLLSEGCATVP